MSQDLLDRYSDLVDERDLEQLRQLARPLRGERIVHVNSTREGGGVAEILAKLVPLTRALDLDVSWEVISGDPDFFRITKSFHNGLQGQAVELPPHLLRVYEDTNRRNAERLEELADAGIVFIHDPQPAALLGHFPERRGTWIWRCHIDLSRPHHPVWGYLRRHVEGYDGSVFSLPDFAQPLDHPQFLVPPSIDPLSEKNMALAEEEVAEVAEVFGLDRTRPLVVQVSRFDRFKDPVGVIRAYQLARRGVPGLQLVLAGGSATDDPEGAEVLEEVREAGGEDPDLHILLLPPDAHRTINALQSLADVVIQKSLREGFGLTVTEGLWKGRPVIGGSVGGIRIQLREGRTGFLVHSPEGCALRIRQLLGDADLRDRMGRQARAYVRRHFLMTRLLRDHLTVVHALRRGPGAPLHLDTPSGGPA